MLEKFSLIDRANYVFHGSEEYKFGNKTKFYERDLKEMKSIALILCFVVLMVCCTDVGKLLV